MALSNTERWRKIDDFRNYEVSDTGRVRNIKTSRILKPRNGHEYPSVSLYNEHGRRDLQIHRLVAKAFIPDSHEGLDINHIDGCKHNNHVSNLEWCTRSENIRHAYRTGLKAPSGPHEPTRVRVIETGNTYESARECAREMNMSQAHVSRCINGIYKQYRGYHFERVE